MKTPSEVLSETPPEISSDRNLSWTIGFFTGTYFKSSSRSLEVSQEFLQVSSQESFQKLSTVCFKDNYPVISYEHLQPLAEAGVFFSLFLLQTFTGFSIVQILEELEHLLESRKRFLKEFREDSLKDSEEITDGFLKGFLKAFPRKKKLLKKSRNNFYELDP